MGSVYLGFDASLGRLVAIKVVDDARVDKNTHLRFTREAQLAGTLRHQNIVTVFGFGDDQGRPFIVMEYLPGETLAELIARQAPMSMLAKLHVMTGLCDGLDHAHAKGIVHRDVKPANVIVDVDGTVKVLDFGIARRGESDLTLTGTVVGTLNYLSPEQLRGQPPDVRSDIFAVGAVFYELVSGIRAFPGSIDDGVLARILTEPTRPIREHCPNLAAGIEACIECALAKRPEDRFQTLGAMKSAIARSARELDGEGIAHPGDELKSLVIVRPPDDDATVVLDTPRRPTPGLYGLDPVAANAETVLSTPKPLQRLRGTLRFSTAAIVVGSVASGIWLWSRDRPSAPLVEQSSAAPTPAASVPPASTNVDEATPAGPDLDALVLQASNAYARGSREEGLRQIRTVLRSDARHSGAQALLQAWLSAARVEVRSQRAATESLGEGMPTVQQYRDARQKELEADRLATVEPPTAILALWTAAASYEAAGNAMRQRTNVPAASPTAPAPPTLTNLAVGVNPFPRTAPATNLGAPPPGPPSTLPDAPSSPAPTAAPQAVTPAAPVIPPGASEALERYAAAYGKQDLKGIKAVFPNLPSDREAALNRAFRSGCKSYDVRFSSLEPSRVTPDSLTVLASTSYTCHPSTGQSPRTITADDVFQLRRQGNIWLIDRMNLM